MPVAFIRTPASVSSRSRSSCASAPVTVSRAASRVRTSTISSRSVVDRMAPRTASVHSFSRRTARSHVRSTSSIGPKCANNNVDDAASRIRSMLATASSRSNSGGGVAGRRTGRSGTWIPNASPVNTTPVDESTSAR